MTDTLHPQVAALAELYRQELRRNEPSDDLDARIGDLVAGKISTARHAPRAPRVWRLEAWVAAAGLGVISVALGIVIGIRLERSAQSGRFASAPVGPPADFSMWPSESFALQVPAEYSRGTLVALDPHATTSGKRYWIDVVVSNDGTVRIDQIVPADSKTPKKGIHDGITLQNP
jgi:hypothetical protein